MQRELGHGQEVLVGSIPQKHAGAYVSKRHSCSPPPARGCTAALCLPPDAGGG